MKYKHHLLFIPSLLGLIYFSLEGYENFKRLDQIEALGYESGLGGYSIWVTGVLSTVAAIICLALCFWAFSKLIASPGRKQNTKGK